MSLQIVRKRQGQDSPALAICKCGQEIALAGDQMGECSCHVCGRVYNIFGQELKGFTKPFSGMNEYGEYYNESY